MMPRRVASLIVALVLGAACALDAASRVRITAEEYGDEWPFTLASGNLQCDYESSRSARMLVTLNTDDNSIMHALNGSAKSFGYPDVESVLKPGRTGADLQPFIQRGLTLCKR